MDNDVEIRVVATELKGLKELTTQGFNEIKDILRGHTKDHDDHVKEDKITFDQAFTEIQDLRIEITKLKERWLLIGSGVSLFGSAIFNLIISAIKS